MQPGGPRWQPMGTSGSEHTSLWPEQLPASPEQTTGGHWYCPLTQLAAPRWHPTGTFGSAQMTLPPGLQGSAVSPVLCVLVPTEWLWPLQPCMRGKANKAGTRNAPTRNKERGVMGASYRQSTITKPSAHSLAGPSPIRDGIVRPIETARRANARRERRACVAVEISVAQRDRLVARGTHAEREHLRAVALRRELASWKAALVLADERERAGRVARPQRLLHLPNEHELFGRRVRAGHRGGTRGWRWGCRRVWRDVHAGRLACARDRGGGRGVGHG